MNQRIITKIVCIEIIKLSEVRQRQISYGITYIWNLFKKMMQMNLLTKQKQTHRHRKQTYDYQRETRVRLRLEILD